LDFKVKENRELILSAMASSKFPTNIFLSLSAAPVLLILIGSKAAAELLTDLGQASEEIFRGDRLPVLKISPSLTETSPSNVIEADKIQN
jgi:hypothetical protein